MDPSEKGESPTGAIETGAAFAGVLTTQPPGTYQLQLYVAGSTPQSQRAIANLKRICECHLAGRFLLEVIDIYQQPQLTAGAQIVAAPTLIKKLPLPLRRLVGDLSNRERVLAGLDVRSPTGAGEPG